MDTRGRRARTADVSVADGASGFAVRLHGRRAQLWALSGLLALLVVVWEVVAVSQHALARWWWPPLAPAALCLWLLVRAHRGVLVYSEGADLVIRRTAARRIPASTIAHVGVAGPLGERVEVVCSSGRTLVCHTLESEDGLRDRLVEQASAWLRVHGGPAPFESGELPEGARVGWRPLWSNSRVAALLLYEGFVLVGMGARIVTRPRGPRVELVLLALLQLLVMLAGSVMVQRFTPPATVRGGDLWIKPPLAAAIRVPAVSITAVQVVLHRGEAVARVRSSGRWLRVETGLTWSDRPVQVLRLARWACQNGAVLEVCDDLPPRWSSSSIAAVALLLGGLGLALYVVDPHNGAWGGFFGVALASVGGFMPAQAVIDVSDLAVDRAVGWSVPVFDA